MGFLNRFYGGLYLVVISIWLFGGTLAANTNNLEIDADDTETSSLELEEIDSSGDKVEIEDRFTIIVDAGHGGTDSGAVGYADFGNGPKLVQEKHIVLSITDMVVAELRDRYPNISVITSRSDDVYLSLQSRSDFANLYADNAMFVSIHINSHTTDDAYGFEVWHIPPDTVRYSRGESVSTRRNTLLNQKSKNMAESVLDALQEHIGPYSRNRGLRANNFYVLTHTFIPGILVESGFISNPRESTNLATRWYQNLIAQGILDGIQDYLLLEGIIEE